MPNGGAPPSFRLPASWVTRPQRPHVDESLPATAWPRAENRHGLGVDFLLIPNLFFFFLASIVAEAQGPMNKQIRRRFRYTIIQKRTLHRNAAILVYALEYNSGSTSLKTFCA